jgi:hypothetical protein
MDESDFAPERSKAVAQGAFRKGAGSDPTGVISCGMILRHDVLHTWCGPYIQKGTCNFRAMSLLHKLLPCTDHAAHISVSFSKRAIRWCGSHGQH